MFSVPKKNSDHDDPQFQRQRMVQTQLKTRGITDERVLRAIADVPREAFVTTQWGRQAFADRALPIDFGQTISQPYTVAFMCEAAKLSANDKILEIGAGSGYGAAVLARIGRVVHTVERIPKLAALAAERLQRLGFLNVHVHVADGTLGLPLEAPFDAIVVTAGGNAVPKPFLDQLAEGGRIILPWGREIDHQSMYRFTLTKNKLDIEDLGRFAFVPLIGENSWSDDPTGVSRRR